MSKRDDNLQDFLHTMDLLFEKAICTIMNFALSIESRFSYTQDTAVNDYLKTEDKRDQRIGG
ncbi:MAG TPA: hypothetical protein PLN63_04690, partial [Paludibacteraceae bacterium]|nr:hypothetical protein [Paludibacteraceae bacterium]